MLLQRAKVMHCLVGPLLLLGMRRTAAMYNGTPVGVPPSFDCGVREMAWRYGQSLAPHRGSFKSLFDALQLENCGVSEPPTVDDKWSPPSIPVPPATKDTYIVHVDSNVGDDRNIGTTSEAAVGSILEALRRTRASRAANRIMVVRGKHYIEDTIQLGPEDSGLSIIGGQSSPAIFTGAVTINISSWHPYNPPPRPPRPPAPPTNASFLPNENNVFNAAKAGENTSSIIFLGLQQNPKLCQQRCTTDLFGCRSWTWHPNDKSMGEYKLMCFGRLDMVWSPRHQQGIYSGQTEFAPPVPTPSPTPSNVWVADISEAGFRNVFGLRVNGRRAIRARYPNANPETSSSFPPWVDNGYGGYRADNGWNTASTSWKRPPPTPPATDIISVAEDWPEVYWPDYGETSTFFMGTGGTCDGGQASYEPPYGYWCSNRPPRGSQYIHVAPIGMDHHGSLLNAPYANATGAIVHAWTPPHWFSNAFLVKSQNETSFDFSLGGFGGGEGNPQGGEWYIENVLEELDSELEWFYDSVSAKLYFKPNTTGMPSTAITFEAVTTKVLFNFSGTRLAPVKNVLVQGVTIQDAAYSFLDPHGSPTGGDWSLQRNGAIILDGTDNITIDSSLITRVDGLGVFLSGYNRGVTISNNSFSWIGESAMAAWGDTGYNLNANGSRTIPWPRGPDARGGDQPIGCKIVGNIVSDIGIWQKQSSMWFQAASAQNIIKRNIHFNGPRAGINVNDGMGGGDEIAENLLANTCRESGDHGPFNSWDRAPYITNIGLYAPNASIVPQYRNIHHNFFLANYNSQEAIDNDDGSSYYNTHHNFFVYADNGLKSDFGGAHNHHTSNIYAYVGNSYGHGYDLRFQNNSVVLRGTGGYSSDCKLDQSMVVGGNTVYIRNASLTVCGVPLQTWVAEGHDKGTTIHDLPTDDELLTLGRILLNMSTSTSQ